MRKQYSKEEITHILDRFMAGETSLAEEQLLADYFRTHEVNDEWREYKEMFALFDSGKVDIELTTSADRADSSFINHHPSVIIRHSSFAVIGIAAAILIAFLLWPESHEAPIKQPVQQPVIAEVTLPEPVQKENVEAETPVPQTQTVPKRKAVAVVSKPQRIASKPRTPVPDDPQSIISTDDPHLVAAVEPSIREQIRTLHIAPDQVMYVLEVSNQPPSVEMPSVSELRARGVRLTADVQQHLQQTSIQF